LKQMTDTMNADLAEATATEKGAIKSYNELIAAKESEVAALTKSIEEKMVRLGKLQVDIVEMKEDLDDTGKALLEDKKFLADLDKNCKTKAAEHAENMKLRSEELLALADTIKILNDDDALDLFKKTLPASASLLQLKVSEAQQRQQALAVIRAACRDPKLSFLALALQGKKVNFDKVLTMIDEMVSTLGREQQDDADKKEYCETQLISRMIRRSRSNAPSPTSRRQLRRRRKAFQRLLMKLRAFKMALHHLISQLLRPLNKGKQRMSISRS